MNYVKIYNSLILRGINRSLSGYKERHHIVPKCLGGSDKSDNLVDLTAEEHYIAHQLLVKIHPKNHSLVRAAQMMIPNRRSNKLYGWLRKRFSVVQSISQTGHKNSQFGTFWISNGIEEKKSKGEIPDGWKRSRLSNYFINYDRIIEERKIKENIKFLKNQEKENIKFLKNQEKENNRLRKLNDLKILHEIYQIEGFEGVLKTGYKYTKQNLVNQLAKLPEFIPQNGKRRKKLTSS